MHNLRNPIIYSLLLFAVWLAATWFLEGRIQTLLRPDAVADRLVYTVVANVLIGLLGAAFILGRAARCDGSVLRTSGFGPSRRSALWVPAGFLLGLVVYFALGAPSRNVIVIVNAYAQVFVVSAAEVVVCWALVAGVLGAAWKSSGWLAGTLPAVVASILFGVYHFGHSPPFNSFAMVGFLTAIGLVTSAFFLISKNAYATIAFHNFLGVTGVVQALAANGSVEGYAVLQVPLLVTAGAALVVLLACDRLIIQRRGA